MGSQMTSKQFIRALEQLELSQLGAGRMLGYDGRTVRNWIAGKARIPAGVGKLVNLALAGKLKVEDIERAKP
jgi:hypothetical protein